MKHDPKAKASIDALCKKLGHTPVYSKLFPSATVTITGRTGLATLTKLEIEGIIRKCPYFSHVRSGFQSGTLVIEFQTLA